RCANIFGPMRRIPFLSIAASMLVAMALLGACSSGQSTPTPSAAKTGAKSLKNPNPMSPQSLATGKRLFDRLCADCHGPTGNGLGAAAQTLSSAGDQKPPDLTDDKWDHGSTDGEIF